MSRESMVFYRSFYDALKDLDDGQQGRLTMAILAYALDGVEPELTGILKTLFTLIRPQLDANNKRAENGKKGAEYGKLGGRPRKNPIGVISETPNVNVNVNENVNVNNNKRKSSNKFCDYPQSITDFEALERKVFKN